MIKFSKWMYELGYNAAIKHVLSVVDGIPNDKPTKEDFEGRMRTEEQLKRKMDRAMLVYSERKLLKSHIHLIFDPDYKPKGNDLAKIMFGDDDDAQ